MSDWRFNRPADRYLYRLMGFHALIYFIWIASVRGFAIFDTMYLMIFSLPLLELFLMAALQGSSPRLRCSLLANLLAIALIAGSAFVVLFIAAEASAAV